MSLQPGILKIVVFRLVGYPERASEMQNLRPTNKILPDDSYAY